MKLVAKRGSNRNRNVIWVLCLAFLAPTAFGQMPQKYSVADLKNIESVFVEMADQVRPSVVAIRTYFIPGDGEGLAVRVPVSQGTGFIISDDGYIVTNRHVMEDSNASTIILNNGLRFDGTLIHSDIRSDLAVLKIEAEGITPVQWGNQKDVKVGRWTIAVGNPFGLANRYGGASVTFGTVSQLGRDMTSRLVGNSDVQYYGNMIETSAAINPGNSGGPLFNIDGQVIGIITAIETSSGVSEGAGFAIPINRNTRHIIDTLKHGKPVQYGFLGVIVEDTQPTAGSGYSGRNTIYAGAAIREITVREGPAARAGLRIGDVVVEIDGTLVKNSDHLVRLVGFTPVGTSVPVTFIRNNVKRTTTVTLGDRMKLMSFAATK